MICPICGKAYPCAYGAAHSRAKAAHESYRDSSILLDHQNAGGGPEGPLAVSLADSLSSVAAGNAQPPAQAWRQ
ncbi:MAG TPA: hypothetical protein VE133_16050, partial [Candidatus Sulfotelmatobacter sp.]|nr:hypothetical protein [Candidatus Sulfotelmatobacter sp.]